jgi:hypothetical protein
MNRIGFVIGHQLREIRILHADRMTGGDFGLMRFGWIADWVNARQELGLHYELYRPWHHYDALVFIKAMGKRENRLRVRAEMRGMATVFDANVNYYNRQGTYYYDGMAPTEAQKKDAEEMTRYCTAVIADSRYIEQCCQPLHTRVKWIPDNVNLQRVPRPVPMTGRLGKKTILWSGQSNKLFEFLAIETTLRKYAHHIRLVLITNSMKALDAWQPDIKQRFDRLLGVIEHELVPYTNLDDLLTLYAHRPGICVAPRFLDNAYNLGHTEWKITLAMACGRLALASPVPSYQDVATRTAGHGLWLCDSERDWNEAFEHVLSPAMRWEAEEAAASNVVRNHYATAVIAPAHAAYLREILDFKGFKLK